MELLTTESSSRGLQVQKETKEKKYLYQNKMASTSDTFETKVNIPSSFQLTKFTYARCKEIQVMRKSLTSSEYSTKLAFQRLPRHMRRRAMSHNVKRLPRRLREKHMSQMNKSGAPPKQKRPSRKYRRKPSNLLEEYTKRQAKIKWLNTHVWHAKRFHMTTKWGYKIPYCPCDKAFTACYRATKNHCLLQDISYFQCIELRADKKVIIEKFKKITNPSDGLSVGSKVFLSGLREGQTTIYKVDSNPREALGKVSFLWKYLLDGETTKTSLWIWNHAAFHEDVLKTLIECFDLERSEDYYYQSKNKQIHLKELRTDLCRFRLSGELSNSVVQNCFKLCSSEIISTELFKGNENALKVTEEQQENWMKLKSVVSTNNLSPGIVMPMIACDPRMTSPSIRTKAQQIVNIHEEDIVLPTSSLSPLWNNDIRKKINSNKITNSEISKIRGGCLIPGSDLSEQGSPVPLIFIQRSGCRDHNVGYSSGWDIILPSSYAQPIWISLIMWGARSGGLREYVHNTFEMGKLDILFPDTPAGQKEEESISENSIKTFFRKPPNRRTNFAKFNIASPFKFNWKLLIENWSQSEIETFFVLRDKKILTSLQRSLLSGEDVCLPDNCLVPVQVQCDKGVPKQFAIICLPNSGDLKKVPDEPKCNDTNEKKRSTMRKQHKTLLKRLRNRRKKAKTLQETLKNIDLTELVEYHIEMRKLWLPEAGNIRNSCSRQVLGFIREGGYSYTLGSSKGLGYIAGTALTFFMKQGLKNKVLIRNTNSRHYFLGHLSIITDL